METIAGTRLGAAHDSLSCDPRPRSTQPPPPAGHISRRTFDWTLKKLQKCHLKKLQMMGRRPQRTNPDGFVPWVRAVHGGRAVDQQSQPPRRGRRGCRASGRKRHAPVPAPHPRPHLHTRGELTVPAEVTVPVPPALQQRALGRHAVNVDDRCSHLLHHCPRPGGAPRLVRTWRLLPPPPIQPARRAAARESTIHVARVSTIHVARVQECTDMCTTPPSHHACAVHAHIHAHNNTQTASTLSTKLVENKLAACVNVIPGTRQQHAHARIHILCVGYM